MRGTRSVYASLLVMFTALCWLQLLNDRLQEITLNLDIGLVLVKTDQRVGRQTPIPYQAAMGDVLYRVRVRDLLIAMG